MNLALTFALSHTSILGNFNSAFLFMDYASHLNEEDAIYRYFGLVLS